MNEDRIKGSWKEMRGRIQKAWGELTDDDLDRINGSRDELIGVLQKRYGRAREAIEEELRRIEER